jgi:hypothetical protein
MNRNMLRSVHCDLILILILIRVDATSVHWLDFNKGILLLEMHGTNIKKDTISVQWAQEDVETSYNLLNNNNNNNFLSCFTDC